MSGQLDIFDAPQLLEEFEQLPGQPSDIIGELPEPHAAPWRCYAIPAATGRTCGHLNTKGLWSRWYGFAYCEACGCTKRASDLRMVGAKERELERQARAYRGGR